MGGRPLNTAPLRDDLEDDRVWCVGARVEAHPGETDHWQVNEDGDLEIQVVTHQHGQPVTAVLGALVGGRGRGVWMIPDVGTEVLVSFFDGDFEGDAVIVGVLPSKDTPGGLAPGKVFVIGQEVIVKDAGSAAPVATLADVDAIWRWLYAQFAATGGHTHICAPPGNPTAAIATVAPASPPLPPSVAPPAPSLPPEPDGTSVLKAE
jgi:hypothetical protein